MVDNPRPAVRGTAHSWSCAERDVLAEAVDAAPSVHNSRPWRLRVDGPLVELRQTPVSGLDEHDPHGRDQRMSCGAALANLLLAVRHLGLLPIVRREIEPGAARLVATVEAERLGDALPEEQRRYSAIARRRTHRGAFAPEAVPATTLEQVRSAGELEPHESRWISGAEDAAVLGRALAYAARVMRDDLDYQRELSTWLVDEGVPVGIPKESLGQRGLSAVGLATGRTRLPDEEVLAARAERESVLVLCSSGDDPLDHVRIGEAAEAVWLEAVARELAASVMTQPLRLAEVRDRLSSDLGLDAVPHLLMRLGHP